MVEKYLFTNFVTKSLEIEKDSKDRIFTGYITAEVIDKQGEFIFVEEMIPILEKFMSIKPIMSEIHTNRICGEVLGFEKSEIEGILAIKIKAKIFKSDNVTLYDRVWKKIVDKEYKGLSIGGASKTRESSVIGGRQTVLLKDLELYEIAICPDPANPFAKIDWVNNLAKSEDGVQKGVLQKRVIQCSGMQCSLSPELSKGLDSDIDADIDNRHDKNPKKALLYKNLKKIKLLNELHNLLR